MMYDHSLNGAAAVGVSEARQEIIEQRSQQAIENLYELDEMKFSHIIEQVDLVIKDGRLADNEKACTIFFFLKEFFEFSEFVESSDETRH